MMRIHRHASALTGFTLLELVFSLAIAAILLGSVGMVAARGSGSFQRSLANTTIDSQSNRAMARLAHEMVGAGIDSLAPAPTAPFGSSSLEFQRVVGWADGENVWSTPERIEFELEPEERDNGLDDDGDGFVDEGRIVRIDDPGTDDERRSIFVRNVRGYLEGEVLNGIDDNGNGLVDERGLAYELNGSTLTIRMSLERLGPDGEPLVRTQETSVRLRN